MSEFNSYNEADNTSYRGQVREDYFQESSISSTKYNTIIGAVLLWGFLVNAILCLTITDYILQVNPIIIIVGYVVSCFVGTLIYKKSDNPAISFLGYNLIVLPIGALLSTIMYQFQIETIANAFIITSLVTLVMMGISYLYPDFFLSLGRMLILSLVIGLVAEVLLMLLGFNTSAFDYIFVVIFCGYIGYDWAKAQNKPRTVDGAVDAACELYVDIINLFIRILSILSRGKNRRY